VWSTDAAAARVLAAAGWDGSLRQASGDALMLVETDISGSMRSQDVVRDAAYTVDLSGAQPRASLRVTYAPVPSATDLPDGGAGPGSRRLLQVYAADGAVYVGSSGFVDGTVRTRAMCGRTVFAGEVAVAAGGQASVSLDYTLPSGVVAAAGYDLLVQQQPASPAGTLAVSVRPASPGSPSAVTQVPMVSGGDHHWQLAATGSGAELRSLPVPNGTPSVGTCSDGPVQAVPLAAPARVRIPAIGVDAPVEELGVGPDSVMESPSSPSVVGWYRTTARAGAPGNLVLSGHVDWGQNAAVFFDLRSLTPGAMVTVAGADGVEHDYAVVSNASYPRGDAPEQDLLGGTEQAVVTLITCDGAYDLKAKDYSDRRFVRAELVPAGNVVLDAPSPPAPHLRGDGGRK
jgi:sortase (surface protein transpeptidase)